MSLAEQWASPSECHKETESSTFSIPFHHEPHSLQIPTLLWCFQELIQSQRSQISLKARELWLLFCSGEESCHHSLVITVKPREQDTFYFSIKLSCSTDNPSHHIKVELYSVLLAKEKWEMKSTLEMLPSEQSWHKS